MSDSAIHRHHDHKEKLHKSARKKDSKKSRHKHSESPTSRHMDDESNMKDDIERIDQKENVFNEVIHRKDGKKSRHRRERSPGSDQNRKKGDDRHREDKDSRHRRHRHRKNSNESEHQEVEEKGPDVLSTKERFADGRRQRYVESPVVDNRKGHKNVSEDNRDKNDRERSMDVRTGKRKEESDEDESRKTSGGTVADNDDESYMKAKRARLEDPLSMKTGGAYIPPARLKMMQSQIEDKASIPYQRLSWEALKKSINGLINKANTSNLVQIVRDLFKENIIRGRGLLARSIMQAQALSPTFTHVYAALVAIINTKFPQIGELILKRLIIQFRKGYRRNDKTLCLSAARFIAHLVNQKVAHEVLSLEILHVLLESPSNDSVELAIGFLKECGQLLTKVSPRGMNAVFERLRTILHEAQIDKRVQYMVEVMFAVRKDGFKDHPSVVEELDIVEEDDQITHLLALENAENPEDGLNVFKADENFVVNNEKYAELRRDILGESGSDDDADADSKSGSDDDESGDSGEEEEKTTIIDQTETNLISLRRTIYLTIQSSLDFEECAHKLMKMQMKPGQEVELCCMILDCCSQQRTFEKFYGLLAQRFCMLDKKYVEPFQKMFNEQYEFIHRLETNKLRNVAKLFAHLLHTDAISWEVLKAIRLNEDDTTSSSRIFIKILFQELCEFMGLTKLNNRLKDPTLQPHFEGLFPRDNPRNTRFSINFFTSIGLGGLTDELRAHLKSMPKPAPVVETSAAAAAAGDDADSSSSSDDGSSSSDSSSDSSDSDSDSSSSSSSSSSEEEKPAPKRLSEFFREHQARETKSSSSAAVSKGNVDKAQQRLLALANYEQQQQQSSKSSSKAKHGERGDSGGRHRHRQDDGDDTRKQHDEGESRRRDASRHSAGNYSDEIRANDRRKSPVKERHRERRTSNERTAGHEHRSKRRSR